jgi:hypothetical protein
MSAAQNESTRMTAPMPTSIAPDWIATLRPPLRETLTSLLAVARVWDAVSAYERDYVQRAGYRLGPGGEWIAEMRAADR